MTAAIRQRLSDVPKENQGAWELIEWAEHRFPFIDLEAPLKDPAISLKQTAKTIKNQLTKLG